MPNCSRRDMLRLGGAGAAALAAGGLGLAGARAQDRGTVVEQAPPGRRQMPMGGAGAAGPGFENAFDGKQYTLPPLPYEMNALEPQYHRQTLQIHHDKHHQGYVSGLNKVLASLADARSQGQWDHIQTLSEHLAFHGSGHVLHTLFWHSMTPGGSQPSQDMQTAIGQAFGSMDQFRAQFQQATKAVEASGWGVLAWEPVADQLVILQAGKHQNLAIWGVVPLLVCDVWEHAYYLQYQNERGKWIDAFCELANWKFASDRLAWARGRGAMPPRQGRPMRPGRNVPEEGQEDDRIRR